MWSGAFPDSLLFPFHRPLGPRKSLPASGVQRSTSFRSGQRTQINLKLRSRLIASFYLARVQISHRLAFFQGLVQQSGRSCF